MTEISSRKTRKNKHIKYKIISIEGKKAASEALVCHCIVSRNLHLHTRPCSLSACPSIQISFASPPPAQRSLCWLGLSALGVQPLGVSSARSWLIHLKRPEPPISLMQTLKPRVPSTEIFMTEETHSKTSLGPEPNRGREL